MSETVVWAAVVALGMTAVGCAAAGGGGRGARPVLSADFESDPLAGGWVPAGGGSYGKNVVWSDPEPHGGGRCLGVVPYPKMGPGGGWESPPFAVKARQYYRATFRARTSAPAYWAAFFWDRYGALAEGDHYSALEPSADWSERTFYFKTKFPGKTASVAFQTMTREALHVDDVEVAPASTDEVMRWADEVYAGMPATAYEPPEDAGRRLPKTLGRLREGKRLRVVLVGDSIANDLSNSPWDVLVRKAYPKADVAVRFTGRGGTGWLRHRRQVGERIVAHKPDLVIFLALSNEPERIGETLEPMIEGAREASPGLEFLVIAPHLATWGKQAADAGARHREALRQVAEAKGAEFLDLLEVWSDYLGRSGKPVAWLLRDEVHMNERGRQVTARALAAHLAAGKARE